MGVDERYRLIDLAEGVTLGRYRRRKEAMIDAEQFFQTQTGSQIVVYDRMARPGYVNVWELYQDIKGNLHWFPCYGGKR